MWDWKHLNSNVCTQTNKRPYWKRLLFNSLVLLRKNGGTTASFRKLVCVHKLISISFHIIDREDWNAMLKFMWWEVVEIRWFRIVFCYFGLEKLTWLASFTSHGVVQNCMISLLVTSYSNVCHQCTITPSSQLTVMVNCFGDLS